MYLVEFGFLCRGIRELEEEGKQKSRFCYSFEHFPERPLILGIGSLSSAFSAPLALVELL